MNYHKICKEILTNLNYTPKILLHSCCAPCSSQVITLLTEYFDITILYYNPNIYPKDEYIKRKEEQIKLINEIEHKNKIDIIDCDYENNIYENTIKGLENEPEGGKRCLKCYEIRLMKACRYAKENNFDYFTTTLTISPLKNSQIINNIGHNLEQKYGVKYLYSDFKKKEGYKRSIILSNEYKLYRQNYCGCKYSLH